ncbi:MAG TPA: outer membrane lipoprotein chaperone LolA [Blastocatellia bacterium]|nr:outer membrane lipoprotein chaperone LolA [Blastocatellia bacterium]
MRCILLIPCWSLAFALMVAAAAPGPPGNPALARAPFRPPSLRSGVTKIVPAIVAPGERRNGHPQLDRTGGAGLNSLIEGLQKKYRGMTGIAADFIQIYIGPDGQPARESGHLTLKRPRKARWDYLSPEKKVFVADGKNVYFYVYGEREATRARIKQSVDPQIPFLFLLGQTNVRKEFSIIQVAPGEHPVAAGNIVLLLVPRRGPEEFKQMLAEVNPSNFEVRRLTILERNGSRMDFHLSNVKENYVAPDSDFTFKPPSGVTVRQAEPE